MKISPVRICLNCLSPIPALELPKSGSKGRRSMSSSQPALQAPRTLFNYKNHSITAKSMRQALFPPSSCASSATVSSVASVSLTAAFFFFDLITKKITLIFC